MATLKTISAALKLVDTKKENLKKAYDDLQSHSSILTSFSLSWPDLDSHFTSIQNSLTQRFHRLESLESQPMVPSTAPVEHSSSNPVSRNPTEPSSSSNPSKQIPKDPTLSSSLNPPTQTPKDPTLSFKSPTQPQSESVPNVVSGSVLPRPELKALCERRDGKGLRKYISEHMKERRDIQKEFPAAMQCVADPAAMILDAMDDFYGASEVRFKDFRVIRLDCIFLLEQLRGIAPHIGDEVKEKSKKLAEEWKEKAMMDGAIAIKALGLLHLVATYGLASEFSMDDLVEIAAIAANKNEFQELVRVIGFGDRIADIIQKLINRGKHVVAVGYIFENKLADKIPPVPILKAYVEESKNIAQKICQEGKNSLKSLREATNKEIQALQSVIKAIESHNLESVYPRASLEQRIEQLERQKADLDRPVANSAAKPHPQKQQQQQQKKRKQDQQQSGSKHPRTTAPVGPAAAQMNVCNANTTLPQYQQPHLLPAGLLQDHHSPYVSSQTMQYGMVGPTPTAASYMGPAVGAYDLAGAPVGFSGNTGLGGSHYYSSQPQVPSGYYNVSTAYGGYSLPPQCQPSYYPQ
ncbi:FRIGIDA-like protein [Quillaja saponaria]|uniref:FRIGIDA-like protein n=1 Tax=Quillaja saponaria TaxID=32244 RepID=A0AAD7LUJ5_QUISA|nr:FRIGIDA-like protein [Quillaja saponaria]